MDRSISTKKGLNQVGALWLLPFLMASAPLGCGRGSGEEPPMDPEESFSPQENPQQMTFSPASDATNSIFLVSTGGAESVSCQLTQGNLNVALDPFGDDLEAPAQLEGTADVECNLGSISIGAQVFPVLIKATVTWTCNDPAIDPCQEVLFTVNSNQTKGTFAGKAVQMKIDLSLGNQTLNEGFSLPILLIYDVATNRIKLIDTAITLDCDDPESEAVRFIKDELHLPCPAGTSLSVTGDIALSGNPPIAVP